VAFLLPAAILVLLACCGIVAGKGATLGPPYVALIGLVWPALFLSLGWNFLQYGLLDATDGVVWGWLIPGVLFVLMGLGPLALGSPFGHDGRAGRARQSLAAHVAPPAGAAAGWSMWPGGDPGRGGSSGDFVGRLERLARLHQSGALTDLEFQRAKRALLDEAGEAGQ
jgi:hypothetical protein